MDSFSKNSDFSQAFSRNGQFNALIQKLINQINNIIHHLLGYITTVYQFHGINFSVLHYQSQLLRMLIPYEIFDSLRLNDRNDISQNYPFSQSRISSDAFSMPIFNQNYFPNLKKSAFPEERINTQKRINSQKRDLNNNNINKLEISEVQKVDNEYQISNPRKRNYKLSCGGRPILEPHQQQEVKKFIHSEAMKGNLLTMQIIGNQAKKIAKGNDNFLGSIGWVKNFFKRFPKMKQYYLHAKAVRVPNYKQVFKPQTNIGDPNYSNHNNNYMNEYKRKPSQEQYPKINAKDDQQQYLIQDGQKIYNQSEEINEPQQQQQYNYQEQNSYQSERLRKQNSQQKYSEDQQVKKPIQKEEKKPNEELSSYQIKKIPSKTYKLKTFKPYI